MTVIEDALGRLAAWWAGLKTYKQNNGLPAQGTVAGALTILERLQSDYTLNMDAHLAEGGAQIIGLGRARTSRILAAYGEKRPFLEEGGRTNRGTVTNMRVLLAALEPLHLE
jgi:hypothetical protein